MNWQATNKANVCKLYNGLVVIIYKKSPTCNNKKIISSILKMDKRIGKIAYKKEIVEWLTIQNSTKIFHTKGNIYAKKIVCR